MSISSVSPPSAASSTPTPAVSRLAFRSPAPHYENVLDPLHASAAPYSSLLSRILSGIKEKLVKFLAWLFPSRFALRSPAPHSEDPPALLHVSAASKKENLPEPKPTESPLPPLSDPFSSKPTPPTEELPQQKPIDPPSDKPAQPANTKSIIETGLHEFIQLKANMSFLGTVEMKKEVEQDGGLIAHCSITKKQEIKASLRLTQHTEQEYELALLDPQGGVAAQALLLWEKMPYFENKMLFTFQTPTEEEPFFQAVLLSKEFYTRETN